MSKNLHITASVSGIIPSNVVPPSPVETVIAAKPPQTFPLDLPFFDIKMTVPWAGPDGSITVTHSLARPHPAMEAEYKRRMFYQERVGAGGGTSDERSEVNEAQNWLWDQIASRISGYPGLADDTEVTPEIAAKMRPAHKELAITSLFECTAEIIPEESFATFEGGVWAVRLKLGNPNAPYLVLKLRLREWEQGERRTFERSSTITSSETQGKTRLVRASVNQAAYVALFDKLLQAVDTVLVVPTVGGKSYEELWAENPEKARAAFAAVFLGEWKSEVVTVLTSHWKKKLSDSMKS